MIALETAAPQRDPSASFRDPRLARAILARIHGLASAVDRPLRFMEVCGTHTMSAARAGLHDLLPPSVRLSSGPGCPVCVTAPGYIAAAVALAGDRRVTIATFGDLIRVPGGNASLERARSLGADVRVVYSALDALALARRDFSREVVFLGVGFETTTPTVAAAVRRARAEGIPNFSVLAAHKTMPRAMRAVLDSADVAIDGILCPGHVSTITGSAMYAFIADEFGVPCAIAGFEPVDMLRGVRALLEQIVVGRAEVANAYGRVVRADGNPGARAVVAEVFEPADAEWRGIGVIPESGVGFRSDWRDRDAVHRFSIVVPEIAPPPNCLCGAILRGASDPDRCSLFGRACTPARPVGPCMVSNEGACAAAYRYRRDSALAEARA